MIVPDASAILEVLLQTSAGAPMTGRLLDPEASLHVPHLAHAKVEVF